MRCLGVIFSIVMIAALMSPIAQIGLCTTAQEVFEPHAPISITDERSIASLDCVRSGSGTSSDPYVISGWDIEAGSDESCIYIQSVTCYIEIREVYLHDSRKGVYVSWASNIDVRNSIVANNHNGVALVDCGNCSVVSNSFEANEYAVWLWSSDSILVLGNVYADNGCDVSDLPVIEGMDTAGELALLAVGVFLGALAFVSWRMHWFTRSRHSVVRVAARLLGIFATTALVILIVFGPLIDMQASGKLTADSFLLCALLVVVSGIAATICIALAGSQFVAAEMR